MTVPGGDNVHVEVTGGVAGLNTAMHQAAATVEESTAEITGAVKGMTATIEACFAPLIALTALFEAFSFISEGIDKTAEFGKQLEITSQKTGIAVEQLSALQYAANLSDVSVEGLTIGLQRLARNMETVAKGGKGPAADALDALKIKATDAEGHLLPLHEILLQLAQRFERMEDGAGKTALAIDLFGRSGADLIPLLNQGASGIETLEKKAKDLGVTMGEDGVTEANKYVDAMKEFHAVMDSLQRLIVIEILPILTTFAGWVEKLAQHWSDVWKYLKLVNPELALFELIWKRIHAVDPASALLNDPALVKALGLDKKDPAPTPKDTSKGPSALELLREEWNKRKQIAIDGDEDLLQVEIDFWKSKLALQKEGTKEYIEIHTHLVDLEEQELRRRKAADKKAVDDWKKTLEEAPKAFADAFRNMQQTAGSFRDFMRDLWYDVVAMSAKAGFDMLAQYAATELAKRGITKASALETIAIKTWEALKWIAIEAAKAAASAYAAIAGIPFVGPALAIGAAAIAFAGVMSLASHIGGGGGGGSSAGGGGANRSAAGGGNTYVIQAMDAKSFKDFASRNSDAFVHVISQTVKDGSLTPKKMGLG
jgi:hypothetical protein